MTQKEIETILTQNMKGCEAEECSHWGEEYFIDVAICFKSTPEIKEVFGDLISQDTDSCWVQALSTDKGDKSDLYILSSTDTAYHIRFSTKLGKAIKKLFDKDIKEAKQRYLKEDK